MEELNLNYAERCLVENKLKPATLDQLLINSFRLSSEKKDEGVAAQVMMKVGRLLAPSPIDSLSMYKATKGAEHNIPTGVEQLDALFGGLRPGEITELVGHTGTGKTWLCHMICASVIGVQSALYVDCSNSFSMQTLHSCFMRRDEVVPMSIIHKLRVARFFDNPEDLLEGLEQFASAPRCVTDDEPFLANLKVIVVDSIASLFSQSLSKNSLGHGTLSKVARVLKRIAYERSVAVVTTNWISVSNEKVYQPALGEFWRSMASTRILLDSKSYGNVVASLLLHPVIEPGASATFEI